MRGLTRATNLEVELASVAESASSWASKWSEYSATHSFAESAASSYFSSFEDQDPWELSEEDMVRFEKFKKRLTKSGFFKGRQEGSRGHEKRVKQAKEQFQKVLWASKKQGGSSGHQAVLKEYERRLKLIIPKKKRKYIPSLLIQNNGKEHSVYLKMCKKYKKEPEPEFKASDVVFDNGGME